MQLILDNLAVFTRGMGTTITLTLLSFVFACVIGGVIATFRVSPIAPLRIFGACYVGLLRNTPLVVLIVLFFFGFTKLGFRYSSYSSAVIVLSVYTGAYVAEVIRSGINTGPNGQAEAARSLGLRFTQVLGSIVLPQAIRSVVAPLGNTLIALTKNSAVASLISVGELTFRANNLASATARPLPSLAGAVVGYLILTLPTGALVGVVERRVALKR